MTPATPLLGRYHSFHFIDVESKLLANLFKYQSLNPDPSDAKPELFLGL